MGIPGLTTFINNRSDRYLEDYELHDTYLVIDGNSIACQIYCLYAKCNCAFGGDYDYYAQYVSNFFDELLKCNITPLVLFDGGIEDKKLRTIIIRTKEKIRSASYFSPLSQRRMKFFPLLTREVFLDVMREKNIRYARCLFEADNDIAAVARVLNCPVLSYDSDFYVYGSLYIPFNTLDNCIIKNPNRNGYMKRCKVYRVQNLLNSFRGLDQLMLPLAAILLGNDYVKPGTFRNFFRHLKLRGASRKRHNHKQCCIEATFIWLSKYTLNKAIIGILSRLAKPYRQNILNLIETNINSYINASAEILIPLGFSRDYVTYVNARHLNRMFKFNGDINALTYIEETCEEDIETNDEEDEDEVDITDVLNDTESMSTNAVVSNLPVWFINEFLMARYPSYFIDLIVRRLYICPIQIEDYNHPSSIIASLKIISVIFEFLKSVLHDKVQYMRYMIRNQNKKIMRYELKDTETVNFCKLPSLFNLREIPLLIRREILNNTLGLTNEDCINELPPEWILYIGCAKYWMEEQNHSVSLRCYLYSILICMFFNIIDCNIGRYRDMHNFQSRYGKRAETIKQERKLNNYNPRYPVNSTIIEAYNEIHCDDCILAAPFFINHFKMDRQLISNPKKFNRYIVHIFAEFQSCLRHTMHLNALLGYPFPEIKVANLFNGTLLYNLSSNFKTRRNIEGYINTVFEMSPSLLRLFNTLLLKLKSMFPLLNQSGDNLWKKQRKKSKHPKADQNLAKSDDEYFSADDDDAPCYDANNFYAVLNYV